MKNALYSKEELTEIAKALGVPLLPAPAEKALVDAAHSYGWARAADGYRSRSERREQFEKIGNRARQLEGELRELDYSSLKLLDAKIGADEVGFLAERADEALNKIPTKGGEPKKARVQFVRELANIYEEVTGQPATRRVHDREYGPFRNFVVAALRPIDPHAISGIDADIRETVRTKKRTKPSAS